MSGTIIGVILALVLLFFIGQALWGPMRVLLRIGLRFILGVLVIFLLDLAAGNSVWSLGLNPGSALVVGLLGLPGLVFLGLLKMFFLV